MNFSLTRFPPHCEKPEELIDSFFTLSGLASLVVGIFLAGLDFWSPALGFITPNTIFTPAFVAFVLVGTLPLLLGHIFIAKRKAQFTLSNNALFITAQAPSTNRLHPFLPYLWHSQLLGVANGVAVVNVLFLFLPRLQKSYKLMPTLKLGLIKDMWRCSAGSYLASLFDAAPALVLPVLVVNLVGAQSNAYFHIAWMIATARGT